MTDNLMAASAAHIDLTPLGVRNWADHGPVLVLPPQATLHERIALAWYMAQELEGLTSMLLECQGDHIQLAGLLWPRLDQLTRLLSHLGNTTRPTPNPNQGN